MPANTKTYTAYNNRTTDALAAAMKAVIAAGVCALAMIPAGIMGLVPANDTTIVVGLAGPFAAMVIAGVLYVARASAQIKAESQDKRKASEARLKAKYKVLSDRLDKALAIAAVDPALVRGMADDLEYPVGLYNPDNDGLTFEDEPEPDPYKDLFDDLDRWAKMMDESRRETLRIMQQRSDEDFYYGSARHWSR